MSEAPDAIGRYKIVDRIGQGGMGVLFLAFDPMLERQVAIKLLRDDNDELRERFAREARSVARLRHPHIVTIFDVGEQDGHPFIAMEYLQGQTLADIIRASLPIDVPRKLQVIDELCDGLSFAHKVGIVHRDVKPANVMVEHDGAVKILDFGIARIAESGMTQAGMLIGTLNYMSPEQVAGQIVDGRSDIFAVGAVLYELLAYRQAFPGGLQNGILNKIMHGEPASLETACPLLDAEVIRIVDRALQKDPESRYQDLQAMRKDLQKAKHRLEQNLPETMTLRAEDAPDTVGIEAPTTPARRPSQTPRWGTDRDGLAKRRADQTAAHINDARQAMEKGDFDAAVVAAEQALLLHAEAPEALRILERARQALDERQLKEWLARGADLLEEGQHTEALALAEHALTLAPGSPAALELRRAIDQSRVAQEQARQRKDATQAAMARARESFERQAYDEALQAADEALALTPELVEAGALRARVEDAIARQRQAALERKVTNTLAEAERLFADGQHDDAIATLASSGLDDSRLAAALDELRQRAARIAREQEDVRKRDEAIAAAVARAKAVASHEEAIALLNEAHALDPARADVRGLLELRHAALEIEQETARRVRERDAQIAAMLAKAASARSHEAALGILKEAQALDQARADIRDLIGSRQAALEAEREEARRLAERQQKVSAATAKASRTKSHEAAIAILEEAAALDSGHAGTRALLEERRGALTREREEARRLKERQEKVAAAVARAAVTTSHEAAVGILSEAVALDADHAGARDALEKRKRAFERERDEARQLRARQEYSAAAIARAGSTAAHEAAIAILTEALARDQGHGEITRALEARRTALAEDARRARERQEKVAAALAKAKATPAHDAAVGILDAVAALDPGNQEVRQALDARRAALTREQEEAQRARVREERIAAAIVRAKNTTAHEDAIAIVREGLDLDPTNTTLRALLDTRQAALDRERELARVEAERQAKVASAITRARSAKGHEAAIASLNEAIALDASNREARGLLETRQRALDAERAEARRVQEIESARLSIVALIERHDFDAAETALQGQEGAQSKKVLKDLRRQLRDAQRAAAAVAVKAGVKDAGQGEARPAAVSPALLGLAAAAVAVLVVGGYFMFGPQAPATSPSNQPPISANPPAATVPPPANTPAPTPVPSPPPSATPSSEPAAAPPAASPADPVAALAAQSAASVQLGRSRLAQNDLRQAWEAAAAGIKADPTNSDLRRLESDIVARARQQTSASRTTAAARGDFATGSGFYKSAQVKESEGVRLQRAGRSEQAIRAFAQAVDLFGRADRDAQQRASAPPPAAEPVARPTVPDTPPAGARSNQPTEPVSPPVAAPPPVSTPTNPPATATPAPKPAPPPAPATNPASNPASNDEELIRATLRAYAAAYASLDVAAVQRVYPNVNADGLRRSFAEYRSFQVQIFQEQIAVNGTEATVTCRVRQSFVPKAGSGRSDTVSATFQLRKAGNQWLIASRR